MWLSELGSLNSANLYEIIDLDLSISLGNDGKQYLII